MVVARPLTLVHRPDDPRPGPASEPRLQFGILGTVEIRLGGRPVELKSPKQQALLAAVLLDANQVVSMNRLIDAIWDSRPPSSAAALVQTYVSALRRRTHRYGRVGAIVTRSPGYLIQVVEDDFDLRRFERFVVKAHEAVVRCEDQRAVRMLRAALGQWRGPALDGLASAALRAAATRLDEARLSAQEERIRIEARLGPIEPLIGELAELVAAHPLREGPRAQLMRMLYQVGRRAEALEVYRGGATMLRDDLGVEPGPELSQLHRAILTADPALSPPRQNIALEAPVAAAATVRVIPPSRLPPASVVPVGRDRERAFVAGLLLDAARARRPVLCTVTGMGGIGKTALALDVGHAVQDAFPGGQLFVPLRGTEPGGGLTPTQALSAMLSAIGAAPRTLSASADERAAVLRNVLAGRRLLVVLDDVSTEADARPLLSALPDCAVIMTSRRDLAALDTQACIELDVLAQQHGVQLLANVLGEARVRTHPLAATDIVRLCGGLPLALRAAAARLASRPRWTLATFANLLRNERGRLDQLSVGDLDVRASIWRSYRGLGEAERTALRELGRLGHATVTSARLAALTRASAFRVGQFTERLVDARLLVHLGIGDDGCARYELPELILLFARELAIAEPPPMRAHRSQLAGGWADSAVTATDPCRHTEPAANGVRMKVASPGSATSIAAAAGAHVDPVSSSAGITVQDKRA